MLSHFPQAAFSSSITRRKITLYSNETARSDKLMNDGSHLIYDKWIVLCDCFTVKAPRLFFFFKHETAVVCICRNITPVRFKNNGVMDEKNKSSAA